MMYGSRLAWVFGLAAWVPASLSAQDGVRQSHDSIAALGDAQEAQREFERTRRWLLPRATRRDTHGSVELIGRFRYFHGDDDAAAGLGAEDEEIVEGRSGLITLLDSLRARHPGDEWLTGQLVRYLVDAGRIEEANRAAESCQSSRWWCLTLRGLVAHLSQRFDQADSLFAAALRTMPDEERCTWTDLSILLNGDAAKRYRGVTCADRGPLNDHLFWLADPSYAIPGNDRRTEHYARNVVDRFFQQTGTPHGLRWGNDYRELVLRYGWSERWEAELRDGGVGDPSVIGHERPGGRPFLPPSDVASAPETAAWDNWPLDVERARERYAPGYARQFRLLDAQVAIFRRDDGIVVVSATELPRPEGDAMDDGTQAAFGQAALALTPGPDRLRIVRDGRVTAVSRLALSTPAESGMLSVEALNLRHGVAARRRFWLDVPGIGRDGIALSDLLLVDPSIPLPSTLDAAVDQALPSTTLPRGEPVHVYWEVYGASGHLVPFALTVIKEGKGFLRRTVEFLGLAERDKPTVRMQWERPIVHPQEGLAIAVQLPEGEAGSFTLRLQAITAAGLPVTVERRIDISPETER
ncbi:MAG: hypothetical protein OEO20_00365 [Gemmatimonadota bacterium]|nr:hypothetical protein [Gemmatimonadota bacterium]MDH3366981.1 hypothetical protein [Gemmatimonadota bacterium]MDH3476741.1 hypothetical protein [Gemmatimonadota bacterium]MDH3569936.1 hypothetical protein [Gemmatimonadota bacterium]MDH5551106.1 hypothetical protein [Gemmatimonadota bacterium]